MLRRARVATLKTNEKRKMNKFMGDRNHPKLVIEITPSESQYQNRKTDEAMLLRFFVEHYYTTAYFLSEIGLKIQVRTLLATEKYDKCKKVAKNEFFAFFTLHIKNETESPKNRFNVY